MQEERVDNGLTMKFRVGTMTVYYTALASISLQSEILLH